jgi:UDP-glucose 4-epimerase
LPGAFTLKIMGEDYPTDDGSAVRDYVYVADLASAHVLALRRLLDGGESGAFNLGVGRGFSVKDVVRAVEKVSGRPVRVEAAPRRAGDPAELVADPTEAKTILGWRPSRTALDDIVGDALRWEMGLVPALI